MPVYNPASIYSTGRQALNDFKYGGPSTTPGAVPASGAPTPTPVGTQPVVPDGAPVIGAANLARPYLTATRSPESNTDTATTTPATSTTATTAPVMPEGYADRYGTENQTSTDSGYAANKWFDSNTNWDDMYETQFGELDKGYGEMMTQLGVEGSRGQALAASQASGRGYSAFGAASTALASDQYAVNAEQKRKAAIDNAAMRMKLLGDKNSQRQHLYDLAFGAEESRAEAARNEAIRVREETRATEAETAKTTAENDARTAEENRLAIERGDAGTRDRLGAVRGNTVTHNGRDKNVHVNLNGQNINIDATRFFEQINQAKDELGYKLSADIKQEIAFYIATEIAAGRKWPNMKYIKKMIKATKWSQQKPEQNNPETQQKIATKKENIRQTYSSLK